MIINFDNKLKELFKSIVRQKFAKPKRLWQ